MPTYEYSCAKCGAVFDHFQSIKAPKLTKCILKGCNGKVTRLIGTGAGVLFKGGGFYETDYRSESYKKGEKKAEDAVKKAKENKSDSKKADSKSESKKKSDSKKNDKPKKATKKE